MRSWPARNSSHHHDHSHHHGVGADADARKLTFALVLIVGFMAVEVAAGAIGHSLALLSDAGHMLIDALAIGISLVAVRIARVPARGALTYGLGRVETMSAQFNGATLLVLGVLIVFEATRRLVNPPRAHGLLIVIVAASGIAVNVLAAWTLARANRASLSIEGSFQHILTDLYAFVGTVIAGAIILASGFTRADAIASLFVAALMMRSAWGLLRDSGRVFLEAAPKGIDPDAIGRALAAHRDVEELHDLHVWEIATGFPALSAHVLVAADRNCHAARRALEVIAHDRFGIEHTTLQVDHIGGDLLEIEPLPGLGHTGS
jgi:cobalt-zinc-cadmium efflux system protein